MASKINENKKLDKEFRKAFEGITVETFNKLKNRLEGEEKVVVEDNKDALYYIVGIGFYRNGADLTSRDYTVYPPKVVNSIEGNYKSALLKSIYMMEEAENKLKDSYIKQICYPIKVDDEVSVSIEDGTFFNRGWHYSNAVKVFNSDKYIDTLITTESYEYLDKTNLKDAIYLFLTIDPEKRIESRLDKIGRDYNDIMILNNFSYEVEDFRKELCKLLGDIQYTIDVYSDKEACKDKVKAFMGLRDDLYAIQVRMEELIMKINQEEE